MPERNIWHDKSHNTCLENSYIYPENSLKTKMPHLLSNSK